MRNLEEERFDFALVRSGCRASAALVFKLSGIRLFIGHCCVKSVTVVRRGLRLTCVNHDAVEKRRLVRIVSWGKYRPTTGALSRVEATENAKKRNTIGEHHGKRKQMSDYGRIPRTHEP